MKLNSVSKPRALRRGMSHLDLIVMVAALLFSLAVSMIGREAEKDAAERRNERPEQQKPEKKKVRLTRVAAVEWSAWAQDCV